MALEKLRVIEILLHRAAEDVEWCDLPEKQFNNM